MANADSNGVIQGHFMIPAGIRAGIKQVRFEGDPTVPNQQSFAETTYTGQGTVVTNTMRQVKNVMQSYYDPLAQTFMLNETRQLTGVNLWVVNKGTTPLIVQLRDTSVGFPTRTIIAEGQLDVNDPKYIQGGWVKVMFDKPYYASANVEYAVVVLANDATTRVGISELGKIDVTTNKYVTSQPYQIGVLLSSANASTWTAHQDKDLTFELLARTYTAKPKAVVLGEITIPKGTSDLLVSAMTDTPATLADADLMLDIYDSVGNKVVIKRSVSDGQVVKFTESFGENRRCVITANLRSTQYASATIAPGTQIIAGNLQDTGDYITRDIPANGMATTNELRVTLEAIPNSKKVSVFWGDPSLSPIVWHPLAQDTVDLVKDMLANGHLEMRFTDLKLGALNAIKLKITLDGSARQRSSIFNLRASIV
ncbi:TPA: hypothetical protein ACNEJR_003663 [Escherichia coli]